MAKKLPNPGSVIKQRWQYDYPTVHVGPARTYPVVGRLAQPLKHWDLFCIPNNSEASFRSTSFRSEAAPKFEDALPWPENTLRYFHDGILLVPGGWLPASKSILRSNYTALIDSCAYIHLTVPPLASLRSDGVRGAIEAGRIVPDITPYVLEGFKRQIQTPDTILDGAKSAAQELQSEFPNITVKGGQSIVDLNDAKTCTEDLKSAIELVAWAKAELINTQGKVDHRAYCQEATKIALEAGIMNTLTFSCVISAGLTKNQALPSHQILKWSTKKEEDKFDSHNPAFDLFILDLFNRRYSRRFNKAILTQDINLALFWCRMMPFAHADPFSRSTWFFYDDELFPQQPGMSGKDIIQMQQHPHAFVGESA